jgi:hypothetical protein
MLMGLNTDVEWNGQVYHVQTEDSGRDNPWVVTLLFLSGAILASRKTSYADILGTPDLLTIVRELMDDQHQAMIHDLQNGRFNAEISRLSAPPTDAPPMSSSPKQLPSLDEMILDHLATKDKQES